MAIFILAEVLLCCVLLGYWIMLLDHIKENRRVKKMTVESLRKSGYKIKVQHHRKTIPAVKAINARGGKTVVEVTTPDGHTFVGISRCSRKENFNKRLGVRIALGRAMKKREIQTNLF